MSFAGKWKRNRCCPLDQPNIPTSPSNLIIFVMTGYFYSIQPVWFNETGQKMMPMQSSIKSDTFSYYWTFYKPVGDICEKVFYLSTSEDIVPVIYEKESKRRMKVTRISVHNGWTTWMVSC